MDLPCLSPQGASDRTFNSTALIAGDTVCCPGCHETLAIAKRTISWAETNWLKGVDNQAVIINDDKIFCDNCGQDITHFIIHPINWKKTS